MHDVFHISKLKLCRGDPSLQQLPLSTVFRDTQPLFKPVAVLKTRLIVVKERPVRQYLVKWEHQSAADTSWVSADDLHRDFPSFRLEVKSNSKGEANVAVNREVGTKEMEVNCQKAGVLRRSSRKGTASKRFEDFIMS